MPKINRKNKSIEDIVQDYLDFAILKVYLEY